MAAAMRNARLATLEAVLSADPGLWWDASGDSWYRSASGMWLDEDGITRPVRDTDPKELDADLLSSVWLVQVARLRRPKPGFLARRYARLMMPRWKAEHVRDGRAAVGAVRELVASVSDADTPAALGFSSEGAPAGGFFVVFADHTRSHLIDGEPPFGMFRSPLGATGLPERDTATR